VPEYDESDTRVDDWQTVEKKRAAQGKSAHKVKSHHCYESSLGLEAIARTES